MTIAAEQACPQQPAPSVRDRVLRALVAHSDANGNVDIGVDALAAETGLHRRTVQRHLQAFTESGDLTDSVYHRWPGRPATRRLAAQHRPGSR